MSIKGVLHKLRDAFCNVRHNMNKNDLTSGKISKRVIQFALPYLLSSFLQTLYGMVDLFVVGLYNTSATTTAVSVGSQVMHMLTVIILGFAMGTTVKIGREVGQKDDSAVRRTMGNTIVLFGILAAVLTILLLILTGKIVHVMQTPVEALQETYYYLLICFAGVPLIIAYNVISSIFRGLGDTRHPLYFVAVACVVNVLLDFVLVGALGLGAAGAALATVSGQGVSVLLALVFLPRILPGMKLVRSDFKPDKKVMGNILQVGTPIAMQDGFIQIAFITITVIANSRGLVAAAAVGVVEKIIGFLFLVPSALLSSISAITAQNMGAGKPERAVAALRWGLAVTMGWGILCGVYCQFAPGSLVGLFVKEAEVISSGCDYLRSYSWDAFFAAIHFCFSGYFCGCQKAQYSFIHNIISILTVRIPGAYLAAVWFPDNLFPMGVAAPFGSALSAVICIVFYLYSKKRTKQT